MHPVAELAARVAELERRANNMMRHGTVAEVDPAKATVRLRIGGTDEKPFLSPPIPYGQIAGAMKVHTPPSVGQQMTLLSPTGDFRQAVAMPLTWSDQNASPSQAGDQHVLKFGSCTITIKGDEVHVEVPKVTLICGGSSFELTGGGLKMNAADYQFD
ncbi:phage baseplate assembly protein V [Mesorhizobium sp. M2A.F.Ca.ET.039.01.1.1]|uniref:phage baseplate assembly protein V n=1 Tax=Mesorhizobium sp. M2A.F.Ca.ET.039.01.1.1 TaxID=2496746 RepID=UPI000FC9A923|nr:phage baseplate assembly protein V [Mesorhizobium sp. M2A.F.Ca.ET.039.01.1.1]RWX72588.1 hypothetical protein EOA24_00930 [Mesorhizobium sp. M2A.F.Ca.ET.039.01.1.1]